MTPPGLRPGVGGSHELVLDDGPVDAELVAELLAEALEHDDVRRVEIRVDVTDHPRLRALSRAGMRREGVLRMPDGDQALLARVVGDPQAGSHDGFIAMLNAGLPRKRVISQGLLHDADGRVLLCELTYKREWDLPGGVVEPSESPADGLVRELEEELGIEVQVLGLRTVNWLAPWREWDDACVFVFDLAPVDAASTSTWTLQPTEIAAVHWCDPATVAERAAAATVALLEGLPGSSVAYRERGIPR
ncbi:MAG: NUDIX hydrolase [Nocardioidaceae bacterium]|nr:NUDIX hydrolase [Nocardioidaceae bacterium]